MIRTVTTVGNIMMPLAISVIATAADSLQTGLLVISVLPLSVVLMGWLLPETGPRAQVSRS